MFKKQLHLLLITALLVLLFTVSSAADSANVALTFIDATTGQQVSNVFVQITIDENTNTYFIEQDQTLNLNLDDGNYLANIIINDPSTTANDYFAKSFLEVDSSLEKNIFLYPGGSLSGIVKDDLGFVIASAELKIECSEIIEIDSPTKTDNFGSFSLDYVPIGSCTVRASYDDATGSQEIDITKGDKVELTISLDTTLINQNQNTTPWIPITFLIILIVIITSITLIIVKRKKKNTPSSKENEETSNEEKPKKPKAIKESVKTAATSTRATDLIGTLRDNEKTIVNHLLKDPTQELNFSKIHYETGLAKASLSRNINSLEKKNIIESRTVGRVKKIKLTQWFLE